GTAAHQERGRGSVGADACRPGSGRQPPPLADSNPCPLPPLQGGRRLRPRRPRHGRLPRREPQKAVSV
ncbi:MAG: hypothetical protein AVDCRST_MAG25-1723, partial [uncultured Rubrobacteraceae bacterium]